MEFENKKLRDVAEIARQIMVGEDLKGGQVKLDKNHNGKIDGQDFKILKGQKKEVAEAKSEEDKETAMCDSDYENSAEDKKEDKVGEKKMKKEEVEQIDELKKSTMGSYVKKASSNLADRSFDHGENEHRQYGMGDDDEKDKEVERDEKKIETRKQGISRAATKLSKEEVDQAAATILEYESKDGKFVHRARPGVYGGTKDEKHAVDTLAGPKTKELKAIESEKKKKKFSEDLDLYKEGGIKGLFEAWAKKKAMKEEQEQISEEPTSAEFDAQLADAKQRAAGTKKQPEVSKPAVQAVQNEETHTTVEVWDLDTTNGVQHSEIDLAEIQERTLTEPETKKKEEIVKSMKKGISGFKDRYGKDAKSVMYATATKQAKGE